MGYMQSIRGSPEVQLFGQGNDCKQVTDFNAGNTAPSPVQELGDTRCFVLPFVRESDEWLGVWNPTGSEKFPETLTKF